MNKVIALLPWIICLFPITICAQSSISPFDSLDVARLRVMYELTYREDTSRLQWAKTERILLLIGTNVSDCESYGRYCLDRIRYERMKDGSYVDWFASQSHQYSHRFNFQVFKNHPKGKITYSDRIFLEGAFKYEENMDLFEWDILDDTLVIEGYKCQKAVCQYGGRDWEAWFTDELPFDDGPWKFHGLPGLILRVADTRHHYVFDFVSIEVPDKGTNIEWYDIGYYGFDYLTTTRQGFFKAEDDLRENIMSHFDDRTDMEAQKNAYNAMKSRNNPIELDRK